MSRTLKSIGRDLNEACTMVAETLVNPLERQRLIIQNAMLIRKEARAFFKNNEVSFVAACKLLPHKYAGMNFNDDVYQKFADFCDKIPQIWEVNRIKYIILSIRQIRLEVSKKTKVGTASAEELQGLELIENAFGVSAFEVLLGKMIRFCELRDAK